MRCKYCNVEIDDNVKVCPLCHEKLDGYVEGAPTVYPQKNAPVPTKKHKHMTFNNLYWSISMTILLICITITYIVTPDIPWCWLVALGEIYGYIFVVNTIKSNSSISLKIVLQAIAVFCIVAAAIWIFGSFDIEHEPDYWVLNYALPGIIGVGNIVLSIFTSINYKKRPSMVIDAIFILLSGYIPIIMFWCKTTEIMWIAVTVAVISAIAHLCCIIFYRNEVKEEAVKRFHM